MSYYVALLVQVYGKIKFCKCAYAIYTTTRTIEKIFLCAFSVEIKDISLRMEEREGKVLVLIK